jgi:signal transduction histidine kinase
MSVLDFPVVSPQSGDGLADLADGLRVASHEIRQPVAAVLALAEAARTHPDATPELQTFLDRIVQQATQISETARSVLDLDHLRSPAQVLVRLDDVLDEALEPFRLTWSGTLVRHTAGPSPFVLGDAALLRRSIVNVVENATRAAGPRGTVHVDVRDLGEQIAVQVDDDGPGFGKISSGTRIGLALTRRAVEGMGGSVRVGSSPGTGGSRVVLTVPQARAGHERSVATQRAV